MQRHVERRFSSLAHNWRMLIGLKLSLGISFRRFSIASQSAYATSLGRSAWTIIGQPLKSTVGTSRVMPLKRDFGTTEVW